MTNVQTLRELRTLTISLLSRLDDEIARGIASAPPEPTIYMPPPVEAPATNGKGAAAKPNGTRNPLLDLSTEAAILAILKRGNMRNEEIRHALETSGRQPMKIESQRVLLCKMAKAGKVRRVSHGEYALPETA
jgi:hypothetical protein